MRVAVLCARKDSIYKTMPACEVYDEQRDMRTYGGGLPVIAHPPCRGYGRLRTFSKHSEDELELGRICVRHVQHDGGVLEHPSGSTLFGQMGLPRPGEGADAHGGWTMDINQRWFGHRAIKRTWLYIVGVLPIDIPRWSLSLKPAETEVALMGRAEREATPPELATWLVQVALAAAYQRSLCP